MRISFRTEGRQKNISTKDLKLIKEEGIKMEKKLLVSGVIVITLAGASIPFAQSKGDAGAGKIVYERSCATCHGKEGKGDGPGAMSLKPRPTNLTDPAVTAKSDKEVFDIITKGKSRTPMIAFEKSLSEEQRWNVLAYIRSLAGGK